VSLIHSNNYKLINIARSEGTGDGGWLFCIATTGGARSTGKHRSEVGQNYNINLRV